MLYSKKSRRDSNTQTQFEKVNKLQRISLQAVDESVMMMKASPCKPMGSSIVQQVNHQKVPLFVLNTPSYQKTVSKLGTKVSPYGNATVNLFDSDDEDFGKNSISISNKKRGDFEMYILEDNNKARGEKNEGSGNKFHTPMKHLSDFVSELGKEELLYAERMCRERYGSFCREIMKKGRDVFVNQIFYWLSQETGLIFMSELRLVCSEWNQMLREITFMRIDDHCDCSVFERYQLDKNFPSIESIRASSGVLTNFTEPCKRMKSLEVHHGPYYEDYDLTLFEVDSYSIEGWNSLTTLKLYVFGQIKGIEKLTSLTELQCKGDAFKKPEDLLNLVNLTHLTIRYFPIHISYDYTYMTRLTKLSHLESDYPGHFIGFSGTGRLDSSTFDHIQSFFYDRINKHFNHFQQGEKLLLLEGRWDKGIFSGRCFISISDKQGIPTESYKGIISEGKLITKKEF